MDTAISHEDDAQPKLRFRAIFISDIHLGTPGCQAAHLLDFLRHTESRYLYLVGDVIDGWQLKRGWYWQQSHNDVIQKVLRKARKGTQVTYIAGNHDEALRHFLGMAFGGIEILAEAEHRTADGKRLLVIHGDLFDAVVQGAKWLAYLGDRLYMLSLKLNQWFNRARAELGLPYWSLAQFLKQRVKNAVSYIGDFEAALAQESRRRGFDARGHCVKRGLAFTTAYHTCFPEYVKPRFGVPLGITYAWLRRFHAASSAVLVATPAIRALLEARGFANIVDWSRGVDTDLFTPGESRFVELPRPVFLFVGRVAMEKNLPGFLALDLPGTKLVGGDCPHPAALPERAPDAGLVGAKT